MTPKLRKACERAVHVVRTDGRVLRAGRACLFIKERLGWGRLAKLLSWPPFVWPIEWGYRVFADHRPFFARWMLTEKREEKREKR